MMAKEMMVKKMVGKKPVVKKTSGRNNLIIGGKNVTDILNQKYKALKKTGWITLLNAPLDKYMEVNTEAIRVLVEDFGFQGVYITVNRPFSDLMTEFSEAGLDTSKLRFVDAISQMYGHKAEDSKQCRYVPGPLSIEAISKAVRDFIPEIKTPQGKIFVFIDSITTVLLYNHLPRTVRFSDFLTKDLRKMKVNGIMVSVAAGMTSERLVKK